MGELSVTVVDVVVIAVVLVSAGFAMWRGLIAETFAIFEWVLGAIVAIRFAPVLKPMLAGVISSSALAWIAAFLGAFLIVFIPLSILSHRLSELVKASDIGPVDRALGLVFGIGRGLVIVGLGYIAFAMLVPLRDHPVALTQAKLYPLIQNTSEVLLELVPGLNRDGKDGKEGETKTASQNGTAETAANSEQSGKTYGASERRALDRLIEATGRQDSSR